MSATKLDPALWTEAKRRGIKATGGRHSARAMQWAVRYYKAHGGRYGKDMPRADTHLAAWTRQRWRTASGDRSCDDGGRCSRRYLPDKDWSKLTAAQIRKTNAAKARGSARGRQYVPQPADVRRRLRGGRRSAATIRRRRAYTAETTAAAA